MCLMHLEWLPPLNDIIADCICTPPRLEVAYDDLSDVFHKLAVTSPGG